MPATDSIDALAPLALHGLANDAQRAAIARLLAEDPAARQRFLDHALLHSALAAEAKAGRLSGDALAHFEQVEHAAPRRSRPRSRMLLALAAVGVALLAVTTLLPTPASAALDRVIEASTRRIDRTYRIEVLEPGGQQPEASDPARGRYPAAKHLDGATLWLRGPDQFALRQALPDGTMRLLGSDGRSGWALRGRGLVETSADPTRFGGGIVTKHGPLATLDLNASLLELKRDYATEWLERPDRGTWKLRASRRSADTGGAKQIDLWFDPASGLLERMVLRHLPRGTGGPRSVALVLESSATLAPEFFTPTFHQHPR